MRSTDKPVLLISNDLSSDENNTLTSFSGSIPPDFLNENKSWRVAVDSCGFDFMLKQPISSKHENHPSLIQITFKNLNEALGKHGSGSYNLAKLDLRVFENGLKLFVDRERPYTQKSLVEDFQRQFAIHKKNHEKFDGVPFKYEQESEIISFGQFENNGEDSDARISKLANAERRNARTYVFINARFREGLDIQPTFNLIKTTEIDGELYYYFFNSRAWKLDRHYRYPKDKKGPILMSAEKDFPLKEPEIIQITSPDIEHNINSDIFCRSLCQFTVKKSEIKKYINKEFNNHLFSDVLNNRITRFRIKFVDEKLDEIHLTRGLPSWVKLLFSPEMENKRNVHISSGPNELHPENDMSNFSVELKQTMDFSRTDDPKVALTRLSFKNKWKIMPGLKLDIYVFHCDTDLVGNCDIQHFACPRGNDGPRNFEDVIQWCKDVFDSYLHIKMEKQDNGNWSMKFPNSEYLIILGSDLVQCLGLSYLHRNSGDVPDNTTLFTDLKKNNGGSRDVNAEDRISMLVQSAMARYIMNMYRMPANELPFESTGDIAIYSDSEILLDIILEPREIQLYPNELYIFFNIIEPWPVMGQNRQLLKIVPLKQGEHDENLTIDFDKLEYHPLSELHPRLLNFRIATIDGILVEPFDINDKMYMTLQFSFN